MSTTTFQQTIGGALNTANPNDLADILRQIALGTMLTPLTVSFTGLASSAVQNITTAAAAAAISAGAVPAGLSTLPAILGVVALRDAHSNIVVDAGGAAVASTSTYPGTVLLSADGTTLTFAAAVTAFTITYIPRAAVDLTASYNSPAPGGA